MFSFCYQLWVSASAGQEGISPWQMLDFSSELGPLIKLKNELLAYYKDLGIVVKAWKIIQVYEMEQMT